VIGKEQKRRGAKTPSEVPIAVVADLSEGLLETSNFMEQIALDLEKLVSRRLRFVRSAGLNDLPFKRGLICAGQRVASVMAAEAIFDRLQDECDTVRSIAALAIASHHETPRAQRLALLMPLADDRHFGVREWAWIGLREVEGENLIQLIPELTILAQSKSAFVRRFASEVTRPRGVWCRHLKALKEQPDLARQVIELLMSDPSPYVQLSVGNWLNDTFLYQPEYVRRFCDEWLGHRGEPSTSTVKICRRALRNA
jgi:3-methyladenine DNA glycosylase AlkC